MHYTIGNLGHLFIVLSFVTSAMATFAYFISAQQNDLKNGTWRKYARSLFYIHGLAVVGVVVSLFSIIYNHYYEYHYAWSHSSNHLPVYYMISCFWEGQEGSFLLWIFWHAVLGFVLIKTNDKWEAPVMAVFSFVQAFLTSMILGAVIPGIELKIGSSPFMLLRDVLDAPIFASNPDFIPEDGTGLNPLLQNYWMVIHPPTLFLGFATTIIPFAFCIAGLWKKEFKAWIRPALPWILFSAMVLGVGILMGAYWAYETLTFGGYWSWDPVENAVYVPWIILVACYHVMITYQNSDTALKTSFIMVIAMYTLMLYSTFLTRSGILGESSVHSFTDLGLSGQLLLYLLTFLAIAIVLMVINWKKIPSSKKEVSAYSREFWIFIGVTTLCLMGFQVLLTTSIPVYNSIVRLFGGISNAAPPTDAASYYATIQLWFAAAVALLSGSAQFFWWRKMDAKKLMAALTIPLIFTLLVSSLIMVMVKITDPGYIVLLTAGIYTVVANATVVLKLLKMKVHLAGGSIAHIGIGMMLIGILFSSGYSNVISLNFDGRPIFKNVNDTENRENIVLWIHEKKPMKNYSLLYKGARMEIEGMPGFVDKSKLVLTDDPYRLVTVKDLIHEGKTYFSKGDTVAVMPENTYYEIEYSTESGSTFSLYPRVQINPTMGMLSSPDIKRGLLSDLYTHASAVADPTNEVDWGETKEMIIEKGERFFLNDYVAVMEEIGPVTEIEGVDLKPGDVAVKASIKLFGELEEYLLEPSIVIKGEYGARIPAVLRDLGLKVTIHSVDPQTGVFTFGVNTTQKDYIVLKAIEKPLINVLWLGTIVLVIGFCIAIVRRYKEFYKSA